jgi:hypothetical protein
MTINRRSFFSFIPCALIAAKLPAAELPVSDALTVSYGNPIGTITFISGTGWQKPPGARCMTIDLVGGGGSGGGATS